MPLELILPHSASEHRRRRQCFCCGATFTLDQKTQWVRHMNGCTKKHADRIEEGAEQRLNNGFMSPLDKELYDHIRQGGT